MFIALNHNKERVPIEKAVPKAEYYCPVCGASVITKTGKIKRSHFAHAIGSDCDWGDMSDWHVEWQEKFPVECREYVMENNGERHRADVFIEETNTVVEFQHSPIPFDEFNKRNKFYTDCGHRLLWIFDATNKLVVNKLWNDAKSIEELIYNPFDTSHICWRRKNHTFERFETLNKGKQILVLLEHIMEDGRKEFFLTKELSEKEIKVYRLLEPITENNVLKSLKIIDNPDVKTISELKYISEETKRRKLEKYANRRAW